MTNQKTFIKLLAVPIVAAGALFATAPTQTAQAEEVTYLRAGATVPAGFCTVDAGPGAWLLQIGRS